MKNFVKTLLNGSCMPEHFNVMPFTEECWFMRGMRLGRTWIWRERHVSRGGDGGVGFDWERAWDDKSLVGWRHTHPGEKFDIPSAVDDRTMRSWVVASGGPMVCGVTCGASTRYFVYKRRGNRSGRFAQYEMRWTSAGFFKIGRVTFGSFLTLTDVSAPGAE